MKKVLLLLIMSCVFLTPKETNSQSLTTEIIEKYVKFLSLEEKSVMYEVTIEYDAGTKTFVKLGNKITSYDVSIPELSIQLSSPDVQGLRLENGTVWIGSSPTSFNNVDSIDVHREIWYDGDSNVISDVVYSESPTTTGTFVDIDSGDTETKEFVDALVKFINSKSTP